MKPMYKLNILERLFSIMNKFKKPRIRATLKEVRVLQQQLTDVQLTVNSYILRQALIASLISAKNENQGLIEYKKIIHEDFLQFSNAETPLNEVAATILSLQEIEKELTIISSFPDFYRKRSIAIAGGFSAGKSEFICSLFSNNNIRLPIGLEPTTAIPTYIMNDSNSGFFGSSSQGGIIDLLKIDPDFQNKLSHDFINSFGFNLKSIMPQVFLTTQIPYQNLCFIDTPGYNPSAGEGGFQDDDIKTAEEFAHSADALIWLIGIDANGTISRSDLDFLENITQDNQKPLYIVLNKSDLRPPEQLIAIMDEIIDVLDDYGIEIEGISAYSSIRKQEINFYKKSINDFFAELDIESEKHESIIQRIYTIDKKYQHLILRQSKQRKQLCQVLNSLRLDLLQGGFDDVNSDMFVKIGKVISIFTSDFQNSQLKELGIIIKKLVTAINNVFGQTCHLKRHVLSLDDVEVDDRFNQLFEKDIFPDDE